MKKKSFIILMWFFVAGLFYLGLQSIDLDRAWIEFSRADPFWLFGAVFFNACILLVWTLLWRLLLPEKCSVPFSRIFQANSYMSTSCNTIPFPGGHAVGVMALARRAEVGHSIALSVLALDQLMEGFAKIFVLTLVAIFVPLPEPMRQGILVFVFVIGFFAAIMFYLAHKQPRIKEDTVSFMGKVRRFVSRWSVHLEILRDVRIFSFGLLLAFLMMFAQTLGIWAVQKSLGLDLPFWAPILVMGALNLATVLPVTPGNFGIYEGTAFLAYQFYGLSSESALSLALLQHLCFLIPMVGSGYLVLLFLTSAQKQSLSEEKWVPDET
ncbi:MAG: flippase-like domain-containing protein [Nitrospina sp.]|nr:flippase-like domain-containing protein [Nitrospina sp.]MBT3415051.1 flippase-like domain-containing protein [Nitrospina sp.]MBT3855620.1 flippase-like domain-containing protein [Nitrospina sp.]MBT4104717.1 flippase-like domain-containing protein [Nitrospina sp.]MBT4390395.1 flippase-like domain-containing protein [Nitrospina sp.]